MTSDSSSHTLDNQRGSIGEKLRTARIAQSRSLDDVASATRINRKFLDEIERGVSPRLPGTYVRAFIKAYAQEVGLDPEELLERTPATPPMNSSMVEREMARQRAPIERASQPQPKVGIRDTTISSIPGKRHQLGILTVVVVLLGIGLFALVFWMRQERQSQPTQEISFTDVVKEHEGKQNAQTAQPTDSFHSSDPLHAVVAPDDSLTLDGVATDTTWIHVIIDSTRAVEQTLSPLYRVHWRAKNSFSVSVGNASGISFTLNGIRLGPLSTVKRVVKNVVLTHKTLDKIK